MLNLNYNINKALGGGGCIGVMKYNYSASIVVAGGGGGGSTGTQNGVGGGGGGGMAVTQSISIVPNVTYQINVGVGGAVNNDGQDSYLIGVDDVDNIPISFFAGGGKKGLFNGGDSGTGSLVRDGVVTPYPAFTGGTGVFQSSAFGPRVAGGGGASNEENGVNGIINPANESVGGRGGNGVTSGGGGGALGAGPSPVTPGTNGVSGTASSGVGRGGDGQGVTFVRNATAGTDGGVIISYTGKQKAFVTGNVTTTYSVEANRTTHTFASGSGTFLYTYPYPWEDVVPYQVVLCPPLYR